jgi:hypothetical protein
MSRPFDDIDLMILLGISQSQSIEEMANNSRFAHI